tara:strand:- start:18172 stop:18624 length:453 start_codon:yes stop_codon:yes gene_type:complete
MKLNLIKFMIISVLMMNTFNTHTFADTFSDSLGQCFVRSTSAEDKNALMKWLYILISEHPIIESKYPISERDKVASDLEMADIVTYLLTQSCFQEAKETITYEGIEGVVSSFEILGKVAAMGLLQDPNVGIAAERYTKYLDFEKFLELVE